MNNQHNQKLDADLQALDAQLEHMLKIDAPQGLAERVFNASVNQLQPPQIAGRIRNIFVRPLLTAAASLTIAAGILWAAHVNSIANLSNISLAEQVEAYEAHNTGGLGDPIDQEIRILNGDIERVETALTGSDSAIDQLDNPVNSVYADLADIEAEIAM